MERGRVFKTAGKVRLIGNMTLWELLAVVAVFAFTMETFKVPPVAKFILSAGVTAGLWRVYKTFQYLFPGASMRHLATWLSQADRYYPSKDPVSRPLVYHPAQAKRNASPPPSERPE